MGEQRRTAERHTVPILVDSEAAGALLMVSSLNVGPGRPGPEDEWKCPMGPVGEVDRDAVVEPAARETQVRPTDEK